jgi:hypothetical protein
MITIQSMRLKFLTVSILSFLLFSASGIDVRAIEFKDAAVEIRNDFVLEPAKNEIFLKPGEKTTKTISVVNRTDTELVFNIEIEDFVGSKDPKQAVVLLGDKRGPYSLKDFITPEVNTFRLKSKQRAILKVNIAIPADAEPRGMYGSLLVSSTLAGTELEENESKTKTVSRIGALYFVRVAGDSKEDGFLKDFRLAGEKKWAYQKGPYNFEVLFENNGNVHLTPSGKIEIRNIIGRKVGEIEVPTFFSLPESLRASQVVWDNNWAFGRYTAKAMIDRNYQLSPSTTDEMTLAFWILPWKMAVAVLAAIIIVYFIIRRVLGSFEIKRRR